MGNKLLGATAVGCAYLRLTLGRMSHLLCLTMYNKTANMRCHHVWPTKEEDCYWFQSSHIDYEDHDITTSIVEILSMQVGCTWRVCRSLLHLRERGKGKHLGVLGHWRAFIRIGNFLDTCSRSLCPKALWSFGQPIYLFSFIDLGSYNGHAKFTNKVIITCWPNLSTPKVGLCIILYSVSLTCALFALR